MTINITNTNININSNADNNDTANTANMDLNAMVTNMNAINTTMSVID